MDDLIKRINELAKKSKEEGLTSEELVERDTLRKKYIEKFRSQVKNTLDNVKITSELMLHKEELKNENSIDVLKQNECIVQIKEELETYVITYLDQKISEAEIRELIS